MTNKLSMLQGVRIYLSGPMDFVASREEEKKFGWRNRLRRFLQPFGAIVYDPWSKPIIVGQNSYGEHYEYSNQERAQWTFENSQSGVETRAKLCDLFYPTVHINRRMVDISDLVIAYCPTNIYSVGTVNEIVRAREQSKPVLLVSPPVVYPALDELSQHLQMKNDKQGLALLDRIKTEAALKINLEGVPSPWYLGILPEDYFFDGFGFHLYPELQKKEAWDNTELDKRELSKQPLRPLLPYLEKLNQEIPRRYHAKHRDYIDNSDWMILQPGFHDVVD